ncbi:MAG TPA: DUF305 domain-containing protein [Acidimicrobiales bacterium]
MTRAIKLALAVIVVVSATAAVATVVARRDDEGSPPAEGSVDVGFARDMRTHHAQAVEMAELLRDRTNDDEMRLVASDVALGQEVQIGQMRGWLDIWGLPPTSTDPPMAWAHGDDSGTMPGLATDQELAALTAASGDDAEVLFLRLMIRHHQGGIHMAEVAADSADEEVVRTLAHTIAKTQQAEITNLQALLTARGG